MKTFKKSIAVLLSVLLIFSLVTTAGITASATDGVTVTVKSKQNVFNDVTKTYSKNETFDLAILWQNDNYLRAVQFETYLNSKGLKVVADEINPVLINFESNITEECQQNYGLVSANFSSEGGITFSTLNYLIKYKILVLDTASAEETITVDFMEMHGSQNEFDSVFSFISYITNSETDTNNTDKFSADATLSQSTTAPTVKPTSESTAPSSSDSSGDSSESTAPTQTESTEPNESTAPSNSTPSQSDDSQPTVPSSSDGTSEPTDTTSPSDSQATEPTESTSGNGSSSSSTNSPSYKLKNSTINAGSRTRVTVYNANGKKVTYKSSKTTVAKIDKSGIITGLQRGTTKLTIKVGTKVFYKNLKVKNDPTVKDGKKVLKNKKTIVVRKGQTKKLTITGKASAIKNKVSVKSKKIAKITSNTKQTKVVFKAMKKGKTTLTIKINGVKTYKYTIKVK